MTIYVRIYRDGRWQSLDLLVLTEDELKAVFADREAVELRRWCVRLAQLAAYWWQRTGYADDDGTSRPEGM